MSSNEHLLDHFSASKETKELGVQILRLAHAKTRPGSGRELRNYQVGLPAACILIACEQLNTTEVTKKSAHVAACLNPKEFKKVYDTVKAILEEQEKASNCSYEGLHSDHKTGLKLDAVKSFITEVENEVISRGHSADSNLTKCSVYFWVLNCIRPRALPATELFAQKYELPLRKFTNVLETLNESCKTVRKRIQSEFKNVLQSSAKPPILSTATTQLPRNFAGREPSDIDALTNASTSRFNDTSPVRRSSRTAGRDLSQSPTKRSAPLPWRKGPIRELPTNDSPKRSTKEASKTEIADVQMDVVSETPSKRRKLESPSKSTPHAAFLTALATPGSSRILKELSPKKGTLQPTRLFDGTPLSTLKRRQGTEVILAEGLESDGEDEEDMQYPRQRFRPVYLEHQQWNSIDPRIAKLWKRVDYKRSAHGATKSRTPSRKPKTRPLIMT